jgi:hypothetical protein
MEDKPSSHKKEKLINEHNLEKMPILNDQPNAREGAAVFQVYNPKTNSYETKSFIKKKKKTNKE